MHDIHTANTPSNMIVDEGPDTPEGDRDTIEDLERSMHNK